MPAPSPDAPDAPDHDTHENHPHEHGPGCGHEAVEHDDHWDEH